MKTVKRGKPSFEVKNFKIALERSGLSVAEFGRSLGISKGQVSNITRGVRKPSRDVLEKLAGVYHVDMNSFLLGKGLGGTVYVELYKQEAAAGTGLDVDDYIETETIALPRRLIEPCNPQNLRAVPVRGDSMIDERICDGDTVIFDTSNTAPENISVLSVDNALLVKRVVIDGMAKTMTLLSANAAYPPRVIRGADVEGVRIAGKVVAVLHRA
jgi:SOS-response transcriptional repressor LexA